MNAGANQRRAGRVNDPAAASRAVRGARYRVAGVGERVGFAPPRCGGGHRGLPQRGWGVCSIVLAGEHRQHGSCQQNRKDPKETGPLKTGQRPCGTATTRPTGASTNATMTVATTTTMTGATTTTTTGTTGTDRVTTTTGTATTAGAGTGATTTATATATATSTGTGTATSTATAATATSTTRS